jgi:hypothetical protein
MEKKPGNRGRSEGWQHAIQDGHAFEDAFAKKIVEDRLFFENLREIAELSEGTYPVKASTTHDRPMPLSVFGDRTTSKTDVNVFINEGDPLDISIKKPSTGSGQVLLCKLARFLSLIEHKSGKPIPANVRWTLKALFGETDGMPITAYAPEAKLLSPQIKRHKQQAEVYQNRLYPSTIARSYPEHWNDLKTWFSEHMAEITDCCFRSGMCDDNCDSLTTAEFIYIGYLNKFYTVKSIVEASLTREVNYSQTGYYKGSTILMPWGFLQGHRPGENNGPYQLQFHWRGKDIIELLKNAN